MAKLKMKNILESADLPFNIIRFWNNLQRNYSREGITVIEYAPTFEKGKYWRCFIDDERKKGINIFKKGKKDIQNKINEDLVACYRHSDFKANRTFWKDTEKNLSWRGFFMPIDELTNLSKNQLACHINFLKLKQDFFPFTAFFSTLRDASNDQDQFKVPLEILAIWYHFVYYVDFLKEISKKDEGAFSMVREIFAEHNTVTGFDQKLPSEQLTHLLYLSLEEYFLSENTEKPLSKLLNKALKPVQDFFSNFGKTLDVFFEEGTKMNEKRGIDSNRLKMRNAFFEICMNEFELVRIQEVIDDKYGLNFILASQELMTRYGQFRRRSLGDRLKTVIGDASIMDRIQAVSDKVQSKKQPLFAPPILPLIARKEQKWYDLSYEEITELSTFIRESLSSEKKMKLDSIAKIRWQESFQNILNDLMGPFFHWKRFDSLLLPQLNCLSTKETKELRELFWKKEEEEQLELLELQRRLLELYKLNHNEAIDKFLLKFPGFSYGIAQEKWEQAVSKHRGNIKTRQNYRIRRMQEFGILGEDETVNGRKEIFLDEMLKVEEEVKPYVLFVKKAFQSALPIRKTVEFHPYRHSHDGVEFDPETVQDQDKWIRGNVMKSLRSKVDKGEVTQINAFCLDSSGSMDHERMRNLFKVLYLLIMGLEDRKSFDAIHFFNTYFVETVNFSDKYTNRTLLFEVLKRISTLSEEGVEYYGSGGTNISDGVQNCHDRIQDFVKEIKEKKPEANVVSSIFVITDGEPSMGVINIEELHDFIESKREEGDVAIKGIYIKPEDDDTDFMGGIFGEDNFVENTDFHEAVNQFVSIMTATYKAQRKAFKWKKRREKVK